MNIILEKPILYNLLEHIPLKTLCNLSLVSKEFYKIIAPILSIFKNDEVFCVCVTNKYGTILEVALLWNLYDHMDKLYMLYKEADSLKELEDIELHYKKIKYYKKYNNFSDDKSFKFLDYKNYKNEELTIKRSLLIPIGFMYTPLRFNFINSFPINKFYAGLLMDTI